MKASPPGVARGALGAAVAVGQPRVAQPPPLLLPPFYGNNNNNNNNYNHNHRPRVQTRTHC